MCLQARSRYAFSFCLLLLLLAPSAPSAQEDIVIGERISIFSDVLDEERSIRVGKPRGYDEGDQHYPVMFVLDGDVHFHHTTGVARFLAANEFVPNMLVVAIENTNRSRDLTPPTEDAELLAELPAQGGADNFRSFLADELLPWVEAHYRTHPYRILVGHSLGGLFAIDTLISRPDLFHGYIAISPSLQWDRQSIVPRAEAFFDATPELQAALFMTVADEGRGLLGGVRKLAGVLDEKAPNGFEWRFEHMPEETHGSVPLRSTHHGLEFIFSDWLIRKPLETYNRYGIEEIDRFYAESNAKYGFDRSVPESTVAVIGTSLLESERLDEVYDLLIRYRDTIRPPPAPLMRLANGFRARGEAARAIELYERVLETNPNFEPARKALTELGGDSSDPALREPEPQ
jgi:uncharacterized protein